MKSPDERIEIVQDFLKSNKNEFSQTQIDLIKLSLKGPQGKIMDTFSENIIGSYCLPLGIAPNFIINGKHKIIPMVTEESSVIAAASKGAKIVAKSGGFITKSADQIMYGQIQFTHVDDPDDFINFLITETRNFYDIFITLTNEHPHLKNAEGGPEAFRFKKFTTARGYMVILYIKIDVKDSMGANLVNSMMESLAEKLKPSIAKYIETHSSKNTYINLKILSNLCTERISEASCRIDPEYLGGKKIVDNILDAYEFAKCDVYRAVTHNKGIMNGIIALTLATGNDTRSIESAAHGFASLEGKYQPLTFYKLDEDGKLNCSIKVPLSLGIIGGITQKHPMAKLALQILNVKSAKELNEIAAAVGLAQNIAALRALSDEGIQKGHMKLHNRKHENGVR